MIRSRHRLIISATIFMLGALVVVVGLVIKCSPDKPVSSPVLNFTIEKPEEFNNNEKKFAISGILELAKDIPASAIDVKVYVKPGDEDKWWLSRVDCPATLENNRWSITSECQTFPAEYDAFTLLAVVVDAKKLSDLPGSVRPYWVQATDLASLKQKISPYVLKQHEECFSQIVEMSLSTPTSTPTPTPTVAMAATQTALAAEVKATALAQASATVGASIPTPTDTPIPIQIPVPPTAMATDTPTPTATPTATDTPRPPTLMPTPTATPQPTGPITLTIYLRHSETDFVEMSDDQVDEGIYTEGKCVYGEAAVQIGETTYHFDKPKVGPGEPKELPDPWRVEFEFAKELKEHTRTAKGDDCAEGTPDFDRKKAQFWVGTLDLHSAVGEESPYSLTMKLYEGEVLRKSIQVFFTVKDAPESPSGGGGTPTKPIPTP